MTTRIFCLLIFLPLFLPPASPVCVFQNTYGLRLLCNLKHTLMFRLRDIGGLRVSLGGGLELGDEDGFSKSFSNTEYKSPGGHLKDYSYAKKGPSFLANGIPRRSQTNGEAGRLSALDYHHHHHQQQQLFRGPPEPGQETRVLVHVAPEEEWKMQVILAPQQMFPMKYPNASVMKPGIPYKFKDDNFSCEEQPHLPGFYGSIQHRCKIFHLCSEHGEKVNFACPEMTLFDGSILSCNWWFLVECPAPEELLLNSYVSRAYKRMSASLRTPEVF